nr:unnamed protein product [Callosobruchus chinensis]
MASAKQAGKVVFRNNLWVDSVSFAIVTKAGSNEANHLRKRFSTLFHNLILTLRYAFDFELDDSRAFS